MHDAALRRELEPYAYASLLRVSLSDAGKLLGCLEQQADAASLQKLVQSIFTHSWCYRPQEMTTAWSAVERRGKPRRGDEPWCVWGFETPAVPGGCA
mmetsp:Transcript_37812/g.88477  ORF Transcript_37812/g.88477 Transcript_37812/m.88477 type:complete len:97 (+) Transcript_37812:262-552(+)